MAKILNSDQTKPGTERRQILRRMLQCTITRLTFPRMSLSVVIVNCVRVASGEVVQMTVFGLSGRTVLVVEAEPQIAEDVEAGLREAGARVLGVQQLRDALHMAQHPALEAAVVAQRLGDRGTDAICRQLSELGIPFMFHTRFDVTEAHRKWPQAPVVNKPAPMEDLVRTVRGMVGPC